MKKRDVIFLNGKFLTAKRANFPMLEPALDCGVGIFETMRCKNGRIIALDDHIKRLKDSSLRIKIGLGYTRTELKKAVRKLVLLNPDHDLKLRLTVWGNGAQALVLIRAKKYVPYPEDKYRAGFRLGISSWRQDDDSWLAGIKSTDRMFYELAYRRALKQGADEALILNRRLYVSECSRSNIFWVKNGIIFTPSPDCGCLPGITRARVIRMAVQNGFKVREGKFKVSALLDCEEAFLTNSLIGVMPVEKCGKITGLLIEKYACLSK